MECRFIIIIKGVPRGSYKSDCKYPRDLGVIILSDGNLCCGIPGTSVLIQSSDAQIMFCWICIVLVNIICT